MSRPGLPAGLGCRTSLAGGGPPTPRLLDDVKRGAMDRPTWEFRVKQMLVEGHLRWAPLMRLVSVEVLRGVGFGARELNDGGITQVQLKSGGYTVSEL